MHSLHLDFSVLAPWPEDQTLQCMFACWECYCCLGPQGCIFSISFLSPSYLCFISSSACSHSTSSEFQKGLLLDGRATRSVGMFPHVPWLSHWSSRHSPQSWCSWISQTSAVSRMWPKRSWIAMAAWTSSSTTPAWRWRDLPIRFLWSSTKRSWMPITLDLSYWPKVSWVWPSRGVLGHWAAQEASDMSPDSHPLLDGASSPLQKNPCLFGESFWLSTINVDERKGIVKVS